ncbi:MAG TPA: FAD:protein FMN transferase [Acidobacteriota bacterium]|nr:FAD:protein FMN transferase [Acidobacteriota bacterium]
MDLTIRSQEILGSHIEIKVEQKNASVLDACFSELERIEKTYSRFRSDSLLSRINAQLNVWHKIDDEFRALLSNALQMQKETDGHFDITVKSDLDRLGYDESYSFKEKKKALRDYLPTFGPSIQLDNDKKQVLLRKQIEIGGFGKGYALDRVSEILDKHNISYYYINAGGDIKVRGAWDILLEHPDDTSKVIGKITLKDEAIACSAPNRRAWGKYHHLINAKTRQPERSVKCIFVLAKTGLLADGYATALFTAGFSKGIELSKHIPAKIMIVSCENKVYRTPDWHIDFFS